MIRSFAALVALSLSSSLSFAAVIDFDDPPLPSGHKHLSSYEEDGFYFYGSMGHYGTGDPTDPFVTNGSAGGLTTLYGDYFTLKASDDSIFSLESVEIGGLYEHFSQRETTFIGLTASGALVSQTIPAVPGTPSAFTTYYFSDDFKRLQSVWLETSETSDGSPTVPFNSYDNFVVNKVPVPAAVWLFGSALAGLGWMKRRRQNC